MEGYLLTSRKNRISPFFCRFQVAEMHAIDFSHKITPKWVISVGKIFAVNVKWRQPGELASDFLFVSPTY
jgi:hypothetical protein